MSPKKPNRVRICSLLTVEDRLVTWTTAVPGIPLIVGKKRKKIEMTVGYGKTVELGYFRRAATLAAERGTSGLVGGPRDAVRDSLVASTLSSQRELLPPRGVEAKVLRKTGANANSLIKRR